MGHAQPATRPCLCATPLPYRRGHEIVLVRCGRCYGRVDTAAPRIAELQREAAEKEPQPRRPQRGIRLTRLARSSRLPTFHNDHGAECTCLACVVRRLPRRR